MCSEREKMAHMHISLELEGDEEVDDQICYALIMLEEATKIDGDARAAVLGRLGMRLVKWNVLIVDRDTFKSEDLSETQAVDLIENKTRKEEN